MKRLLTLFGLLDIVTIIRSNRHIIHPTSSWTLFPLISACICVTFISLVFSAYFLIRQKKAGLWITYGQFPLLISFVVLSFGFLFEVNRLLGEGSQTYLIIFWVLVGLEVLRLIFTIVIHRRYFWRTSTH